MVGLQNSTIILLVVCVPFPCVVVARFSSCRCAPEVWRSTSSWCLRQALLLLVECWTTLPTFPPDMTPEMNKIKLLELNISTQHCFAVDWSIPLSGRLLYLGTFHRAFSSVWRSPCVSSTQHSWQHSSLAGDRRTQGCKTDQEGRVPQQGGRKFAYCDA